MNPILLVDDSTELLEVMGAVLEQDGFEVERARHGQEALKILKRRRPFLILLDLMMPVMNGWEFLNLFRANRALQGIPVIVCSVAPVDTLDGVEYLKKPVDLARLLFVVHRYFDSRDPK